MFNSEDILMHIIKSEGFTDRVKVSGIIRMVLMDEHGKVLKDLTTDNLVTDNGRDWLATRMDNSNNRCYKSYGSWHRYCCG